MTRRLNEIWNNVWEGDSYSAHELRIEKARKKIDFFGDKLKLAVTSTCVDLGCGGGYISNEIVLRFNCKTIGIDFSDTAIESARKRFGDNDRCVFRNGTVTHIPLSDNCADVVLCIGVLEHVPEVKTALKEIKRIVKPGGQIVIFTSNCYSFMYIDRLMKQLLGTWRYGYQKNWSPTGLKKVVETAGFTVGDLETVQGFGDFPVKNRVDCLLNRIFKLWGRYFVLIGRS